MESFQALNTYKSADIEVTFTGGLPISKLEGYLLQAGHIPFPVSRPLCLTFSGFNYSFKLRVYNI